jgi:hypothetical protein
VVYLSASMPVASGKFPSREEVMVRNTIIDVLNKRGLGKFSGAGGGMGEMDFSFHVEDESTARRMIEDVVGEYLPGVAVKVVAVGEA